jgi:RNA polymerase sigma factor (sigma-70 family)
MDASAPRHDAIPPDGKLRVVTMVEFVVFVREDHGRLLGIAHKITREPQDAEDCLQDALAVVSERVQQGVVDEGTTAKGEQHSLRMYANAVVMKKCLSCLRRRRRRREQELPADIPAMVMGDSGIDHRAEARDFLRKVLIAAGFNDEEVAALWTHLEDGDLADLADELGVSPKTLASKRQKLTKKFRGIAKRLSLGARLGLTAKTFWLWLTRRHWFAAGAVVVAMLIPQWPKRDERCNREQTTYGSSMLDGSCYVRPANGNFQVWSKGTVEVLQKGPMIVTADQGPIAAYVILSTQGCRVRVRVDSGLPVLVCNRYDLPKACTVVRPGNDRNFSW